MSMITSPAPESQIETVEVAFPAAVMSEFQTGDQRIALRGISWALYDQLSDAADEHQHVLWLTTEGTSRW